MRHLQAGMTVSSAVALIMLLGGCATTSAKGGAEHKRSSEPRSGALGDSRLAECAEKYTPQAVATRAFAFDGTVTGIRGGHNDLGYVPVTFAVNEWFRGSNRRTVTVDMAPPKSTSFETSVSGGTYQVGSRLLVSGEPRRGGEPLQAALAWGCGFTRYYDESTATAWATATG
jgi:hypothetical protein